MSCRCDELKFELTRERKLRARLLRDLRKMVTSASRAATVQSAIAVSADAAMMDSARCDVVVRQYAAGGSDYCHRERVVGTDRCKKHQTTQETQ